MKVVVDDKIPYIRESIEKIADEVIYLPGAGITSECVKDADALIIRTRTKCNKDLLEGSKVKFIATATIGYDHIDTDYCKENNIFWTNAPGSNSSSVLQYVHSSLLLLEQEKHINLKNLCIGIVGVGNVGSKIHDLASSLGMKVLLNDPPRQDRGDDLVFCDLETIAKECDIITFHTPLNKDGKYVTYHLADKNFFDLLHKKPIIINTSRGEVIETNALLNALENYQIDEAIIDVWENEPDINLKLLEKAFLSTPHIAGYSADGKANATRMSLKSLISFFNIQQDISVTPPPPPQTVLYVHTLNKAYLKMYNPQKDSQALKQHPGKFEEFRGNYPLRREKEAYTIIQI